MSYTPYYYSADGTQNPGSWSVSDDVQAMINKSLIPVAAFGSGYQGDSPTSGVNYTNYEFSPVINKNADGTVTRYYINNNGTDVTGLRKDKTFSSLEELQNDASAGKTWLDKVGPALMSSAFGYGLLNAAGLIGATGSSAGAGLLGDGIANTGYIDTLGGLTDATGTALSGGGGTALSSAASLPDDLVNFLDSPAGGGGKTTDWWKQALSPSSNYTLSDLANVATPSSVSNLLNNVSPSTAKMLGTALGAIAGGSGGGGNSAPADNIGTGNNIYNPAGFSYTQPTYQPYTGGLLFGRRV